MSGRELLFEKQSLVHTLINADRSSPEDRNQFALDLLVFLAQKPGNAMDRKRLGKTEAHGIWMCIQVSGSLKRQT